MAYKPKRLGASKPGAATNTTLYAAPNTATGGAIVSTITACNQGMATALVRVALCLTGITTPDPADYLYYDLAVPAGQTFAATLGLTLGQDQRIVVRSSTADISFVATGQEQA